MRRTCDENERKGKEVVGVVVRARVHKQRQKEQSAIFGFFAKSAGANQIKSNGRFHLLHPGTRHQNEHFQFQHEHEQDFFFVFLCLAVSVFQSSAIVQVIIH